MLAKTKKYIEDTKKLKEDYKKDITSKIPTKLNPNQLK